MELSTEEIQARVRACGGAVEAAAAGLPTWTVDVQRAVYFSTTVTVEGADVETACALAIERADDEEAGWHTVEGGSGSFVAALARGRDADPWGPRGSRSPVPVRFCEHGAGAMRPEHEPSAVKHHAIYEAVAAWAKAKGLLRFGATLEEFRTSMAEFVRDMRAVCVDAGMPFGDVLSLSGPDQTSPFVVIVEDGVGYLEAAHADLEGMFYARVDYDAEAFRGDVRKVPLKDCPDVIQAVVAYERADLTDVDVVRLESE